MRVLLTGSTGWLGRHLAPLAEARGHQVIGLDVVAGPHTQVVGSVADAELVERVFDEHDVEAVIHGGALHKPDIVRYPKSSFVDVNVRGTLHLLEAAVRAGHDRFVFTSTTSPSQGAKSSDAAFTDSISPKASPALVSSPTSGNSM